MTPLTWSIAANTGGTVLAIVLAALAFLRRDQHCRNACTTAQASERHTARAAADIARLVEEHNARLQPARSLMASQPGEYIATRDDVRRMVRVAPPEAPAERTKPDGEPPLLCGDENTRLMPTRGDLQAGEPR